MAFAACVCALLWLIVPTAGLLTTLGAGGVSLFALSWQAQLRHWQHQQRTVMYGAAFLFTVIACLRGPIPVVQQLGWWPLPAAVQERWGSETGADIAPRMG